MKKNRIKKTVIALGLAMTLLFGSSLTVFAAPNDNAASGTFFLEQDSEGYCYRIGDEVEVKIDRGYFTVRCRIIERKTDWLNGNMYYVQPVEKLNDIQSLFFGPGWVHESDIQTINPQPVFKFLWDVAKKIFF